MGDRYSQDQAGLRIRNITREDDGRYLCRGEVPADGRYDERGIDVVVHSKLTGKIQNDSIFTLD